MDKFREIFFRLGTFFFPARCIHCDHPMDRAARLLCDACITILPTLDSSSRCTRCFLEHCACQSLRGCLHFRFAAFSHFGPAASLIHQLKFHGREEIAKVFASYLFIHMEKHQMRPDLIIPVPHTPWHALLRGYRPAELLAKELGHLMNVPVKNYLKRSFDSLPQRCKTKEQRANLPRSTYKLHRKADIADRTLLLIDDVTTTGMTLIRCAEVLRQGFPRRIIGCTATLAEKDDNLV